MKKAMEAALVVAALGIGVYVLREWRVRQAAASQPPLNPAIARGADVEDPYGPAPAVSPAHSVDSVPLVKTSAPRKRSRPVPVVPSPAVSPR